MKKLKLIRNVLAVLAVLASVVFISCDAFFGNEQNVTINLPPISSSARAISSDKISDLKNATTSYRVTANGMTREGAGGTYTFTLPVGVVAEITVECLNSSGNVIVRAKKTHTVTAGVNNVSINLSRDGDVVGTGGGPSAPQPVPGKVTYNGGTSASNVPSDTQNYDVGNEVTLQTGEPSRAGYEFAGWTSNVELKYDDAGQEQTIPLGTAFVSKNTNTSSINTQITSFKMPEGGVVLTAKWEKLPVRTVLYSDGKLIINELPQNRRNNVAVTQEYEAMKDDGSNYVFSSNSNSLWYDNRDSITSVEIGSNISPTSTAYWFYAMSNCTSMNLSNFDTSNVTTMSYMFYQCSGLTSLDLSTFDTSNVTDMSKMFRYCSGLTSLNISNFNTSNVTSMEDMFNDCSGLTSLDVSNFDTSNVTHMGCMFYMCTGLTNLDLSSFNTSNVTVISGMFYTCSKLTTIYVSSSFVTTSVTDDTSMFSSCTALVGGQNTTYDASNIDKTYARIDDPNNGNPGYFTTKP